MQEMVSPCNGRCGTLSCLMLEAHRLYTVALAQFDEHLHDWSEYLPIRRLLHTRLRQSNVTSAKPRSLLNR